ncbi:MAG TPA: hypothetical protein VFN45_19650 [Myxococcaceae bacterium]|nr:hypothetical protein [Myxococcaceae bacterium]
MRRMLPPGRRWPGLLLLAVLASACGSSTDGPSGSPGTNTGPGGGEETPPPEAEAPGPWVPSRDLGIDRFTIETALQASLQEAVGAEYSDSTVWTLSGDDLELRLELRSWFNGAEAEQACSAAAGDDAQLSLALGTPTWTSDDSVYVTRDATCIRVSVARSSRPDLDGATAVAEALVSAE